MNTPTGMSAIITAITTGLTEAKLLEVVAELVPFIIVIVPVALGIYFLRRLLKGIAKGKFRM